VGKASGDGAVGTKSFDLETSERGSGGGGKVDEM